MLPFGPCHRWHHDGNLYFLKCFCSVTPLKVLLLEYTVKCLKYCGNSLFPERGGVDAGGEHASMGDWITGFVRILYSWVEEDLMGAR